MSISKVFFLGMKACICGEPVSSLIKTKHGRLLSKHITKHQATIGLWPYPCGFLVLVILLPGFLLSF